MPISPWGIAVLLVAVMAINVTVWRYRLMRAARQGIVAHADADHFVRVVGGGLMLIAIAHALVLTTADVSPFCVPTQGVSEPAGVRVLAVQIVAVAATLGWALGFGGAELIARVSPGLSRRVPGRAWSPALVKGVLVLVLAASLLSPVLAGRMVADGELDAMCAPPPR